MNGLANRATSILILALLLSSCGRSGPRAYERERNIREEGWIGVYAQDIDREMQRYLELESRRGVLISEVVEDSPAKYAGLREEDIIVEFDSRVIRNTRDLTKLVQRARPGEKVRIEIYRDGDTESLTVRVEEKPSRFGDDRGSSPRVPERPQPPRPDNQRTGHAWLGVQTANMNEDLASYFDAGHNGGVLILSIVEGSPAEDAGIRAGDVIVKIDNIRMQSAEGLSDLLRDMDAGDQVRIEIIRKRRTRTVTAELGAAKNYPNFHLDPEDVERWKEKLREWRNGLREWKDRSKSQRESESFN